MREQLLGVSHPDIAGSLYNLAVLYKFQGKYVEAESFYQRALSMYVQHLGSEHPKTCLVQKEYAAFQKLRKQIKDVEL